MAGVLLEPTHYGALTSRFLARRVEQLRVNGLHVGLPVVETHGHDRLSGTRRGRRKLR